MTTRLRLLGVFLFVLAGGLPCAGEDGDDALAAGAKALRARKWDEATVAYAEALARDPGFLPARAGLGEALLGAGRRGDGLEHLRRFVEEVEADAAARERHARAWKRASKLLRSKDREGRRLADLVEDHVKALVRHAERWADDDPAAARLAWAEAAALDPDASGLEPLAAKLDLREPGVPLCDGNTARGWAWLEQPSWWIRAGAIVGRGTDVWSVCRTDRRLEGNYELRCEIRVVQGGKSAAFLLQGAWSSYERNVSLGMVGDRVLLLQGHELPGTADPPSGKPRRTRARIDPAAWNLFELRFGPEAVTAHVNGEEVGSVARAPAYASGHVALVALLGTVEFRDVEVRHR